MRQQREGKALSCIVSDPTTISSPPCGVPPSSVVADAATLCWWGGGGMLGKTCKSVDLLAPKRPTDSLPTINYPYPTNECITYQNLSIHPHKKTLKITAQTPLYLEHYLKNRRGTNKAQRASHNSVKEEKKKHTRTHTTGPLHPPAAAQPIQNTKTPQETTTRNNDKNILLAVLPSTQKKN